MADYPGMSPQWPLEQESVALAPLDGLVDEMLTHYIDWRRDAQAVRDAYRGWCEAPADERSCRFSAYMAALEREEAAAIMYAAVTRSLEWALGHDQPELALPLSP